MAVIRPGGLPGSGFTLVANSWVRDPGMTLKARGLLVYLLSHAEGYRCSNAQQQRDCADGRDSVTSAREELIRLGYLVAVQARAEGGRFAENDYVITEPDAGTGNPHVPPGERAGGPPITGNPSTGEPSTVGPQHRRPTGEDQGTTSSRASGAGAGGRQLALVTDDGQPPAETINQRAGRLTRTYVDGVGGMAAFMAVRNVVVRACNAPAKWSDDAILGALRSLHAGGRAITLANLDHALHGKVRGSNGHTPHRDAPADAYHAPF